MHRGAVGGYGGDPKLTWWGGEEFRLFLVSLFITFPQCQVLGHVTYVRPS